MCFLAKLSLQKKNSFTGCPEAFDSCFQYKKLLSTVYSTKSSGLRVSDYASIFNNYFNYKIQLSLGQYRCSWLKECFSSLTQNLYRCPNERYSILLNSIQFLFNLK